MYINVLKLPAVGINQENENGLGTYTDGHTDMYITYDVGRLREIVALIGECFEKKSLNLKGCSEIPVGVPSHGNFNSSGVSWTELL